LRETEQVPSSRYSCRGRESVSEAEQMSGMSNDVQPLKLAVALCILVFAIKVVAFLFTGVLALFAEAFRTLSDVLISGFLFFAAVWSSRDADADYMFGHGRAQNVAALVAATLFISFTSYKL